MATIASKDRTQTFTLRVGELAEVLDRRTRAAKTFRLPDAPDGRRRFRIGAGIGPVHYRADPFDGGQPLQEIDLDVNLTPGQDWDAACETNGYQARFWQSRVIGGRTVRYIAEFRRAGEWIGMAPVALAWENDAGQRQLIATPQAVGAPAIDNDANTVTWANAFGPGLSWRYNLRPDEFFKTVIIRHRSDLPAPTIGTQGLRLGIVVAVAWGDLGPSNGFTAGNAVADYGAEFSDLDAPDEAAQEPEPFSMRDLAARDICWLRRPRAWDSSRRQQTAAMGWKLLRKAGRVYLVLSLPAATLNSAQVQYPVFLDTAISEEQVGASTDDCMVLPPWSDIDLAGYYAWAGDYSSLYYDYESGFRFTTVPIPQGVTIDSADLSVCAGWGTVGIPLTKVRGEAADNPVTFSTYADFISRARTTAGLDWDFSDWPADVWETSPDLKSVVQEITNRSGWASNNALVLFWGDDQGSGYQGSNYQAVKTYDLETTTAAKFNCSYTENPAKAVSDTGAAADATPSIKAAVARTDSGAGADATPSIKAAVARTDSGAGADATPSIKAAVARTDSGAGADEVWAAGPAVITEDDMGAGADAVTTTVVIAVADEVVGPDHLLDILAGLSVLDNGVADDTLAVSAGVPVEDAGLGEDATGVTVAGQAPFVSDMASGAETISITRAGIVVMPVSCEIDSDLENLADSVQLAILEKDLAAPLAPAALKWLTISDGDSIRVRLGLRGLDLLDYGEFRVDESSLEAIGSQLATAIRGRDKAARLIEERARIQYGQGDYPEENPEIFTNPTARAVALRICQRVGMSLIWDAPNYQLVSFTLKPEDTLSKALGDLLGPLRQGKRYRADAWAEGDQVIVRRRGYGPIEGRIDCRLAPHVSIRREKRPTVGEISVSGAGWGSVGAMEWPALEAQAGESSIYGVNGPLHREVVTTTSEGVIARETEDIETTQWGNEILISRRVTTEERDLHTSDPKSSRRETSYGHDTRGKLILQDELVTENGKRTRHTITRWTPGLHTVCQTVIECGYDYDGHEYVLEGYPRSTETPGEMPEAPRVTGDPDHRIVVTEEGVEGGALSPHSAEGQADGGGTMPVVVHLDGVRDAALCQQVADDLAAESGKWLYTVTMEWPRPFLFRKGDKVALGTVPGGIGDIDEATITGLHTQFDERQALWTHTVRVEWWADS